MNKADADKHTDGGGHPDIGGGSEPMDMPLGFDNDARAQETDTYHNICDDCEESTVSGDDFIEVFGGAYKIRQSKSDHREDGGSASD